MGTTGVWHADGSSTITDSAGKVLSQTGPDQGSAPPPEDEDEEDPPADEEDEDEEDPPSDDEEDDDDEEGMTDPDAATSTTGLVAGIVVESVGFDDVLFGSSTAPGGGATDGPRGDLDTGNGTITGEIVGPRPGAGPDVDPDYQAGDLGRLADPFHSGTGVGTVDGVRPDLLDAIGGGGAPEMDPSNGVNPYAAGDGDGARGVAAAAHLAAGHDAASFGGAADNAFGEVADAGLHIDSAFSAIEADDPDATAGVGFGGPLDDGFDAP
jgi:hypothetical protein